MKLLLSPGSPEGALGRGPSQCHGSRQDLARSEGLVGLLHSGPITQAESALRGRANVPLTADSYVILLTLAQLHYSGAGSWGELQQLAFLGGSREDFPAAQVEPTGPRNSPAYLAWSPVGGDCCNAI